MLRGALVTEEPDAGTGTLRTPSPTRPATELPLNKQVLRKTASRHDDPELADRSPGAVRDVLVHLRMAKIVAVRVALSRYCVALFLDADTHACEPLTSVIQPLLDGGGGGGGVGERSELSFTIARHTLGVDAIYATSAAAGGGGLGRDGKHAEGFREGTPEANTGVLALRRTARTERLLAGWAASYVELSAQTERHNILDQPVRTRRRYSDSAASS